MKNLREKFNNYVKEKGNKLGAKYLGNKNIGNYLTQSVSETAGQTYDFAKEKAGKAWEYAEKPVKVGLAGLAGLSFLAGCSLPRYKDPQNRDEKIWNDKLDFYDAIHDANEKAEAKDKASRKAYLESLNEYDEETQEIRDRTKMIKEVIKEVEENKKKLKESMKKARDKAKAGNPDYDTNQSNNYNENGSEDKDSDDSEEFVPVIIK